MSKGVFYVPFTIENGKIKLLYDYKIVVEYISAIKKMEVFLLERA